ncbi:hypothetical protein EVAR_13198_1 [Eumeta japonica]|uniref:Uncharacterized protein n=1 Tax=Eumeta variegata TaxID=151549 RepID=A0A4C1TS27_EUMVA|nr:hypothetical protein EVAR_13198_1 [Eumeta japonica]
MYRFWFCSRFQFLSGVGFYPILNIDIINNELPKKRLGLNSKYKRVTGKSDKEPRAEPGPLGYRRRTVSGIHLVTARILQGLLEKHGDDEKKKETENVQVFRVHSLWWP